MAHYHGTDDQLRAALDEMIDRESRAQRRAILEAVRERFVWGRRSQKSASGGVE